MKKTLLVVFLAVMALVFANGVSHAALTGVCSSCHTMHNSQDGTTMTKDAAGGATTTPRGYLLIGSCAYCHLAAGNAKTTAVGGWNVQSTTAGFPSGFFSATDTQSHVTVETVAAGISAADQYYSTITPGASSSPVAGSNQLTCEGCHDQSGSHHDSTSTIYRMISGVTGLKADLSATQMEVSTNHNVVEATGINDMCAKCHGAFHGSAAQGSTSPFIRHPTDNAVTNDTTNVAVDYVNNPWGFTAGGGPATTATAYDATNGRVLCISCHRAHGSANADNLRFAYSTQNAGNGGTSGCQGCHKK